MLISCFLTADVTSGLAWTNVSFEISSFFRDYNQGLHSCEAIVVILLFSIASVSFTSFQINPGNPNCHVVHSAAQ